MQQQFLYLYAKVKGITKGMKKQGDPLQISQQHLNQPIERDKQNQSQSHIVEFHQAANHATKAKHKGHINVKTPHADECRPRDFGKEILTCVSMCFRNNY